MTTEAAAVSSAREPQLLGQTVVLIGGSAGMGLETARLAPYHEHTAVAATNRVQQLREGALLPSAPDQLGGRRARSHVNATVDTRDRIVTKLTTATS